MAFPERTDLPVETTQKPVLVLGVGNVLMGDEGIGVHAIQALSGLHWPEGVSLVDGGTGGFHLLSYLRDYDPVILIDATMDGKEPGTVTLTRPRFASDFPRTLSAHDIGLRDLIESAELIGPLPTLFLVTISIDALQSMCMEISPRVGKSLPQISTMVRDILREIG